MGSTVQTAISNFNDLSQNTTFIVGEQISTSLKKLEDSSMGMYYRGFTELLSSTHELTTEEEVEIKRFFNETCLSNNDILSIYLVQDDLVIQGGRDHVEILDLMRPYAEEIQENAGRCLWYPVGPLRGKAGTCNYVLARSINSREEKNVATLYFVIDSSIISERLESIHLPWTIESLADGNGIIFYSIDSSMMGKSINQTLLNSKLLTSSVMFPFEGKAYTGVYQNLMHPSWFLVRMFPIKQILQQNRSMLIRFFVIAVIYIGFLVGMLLLLQRYIFNPLQRLKREMDTYAQGTLKKSSITPLGVGELASLSRHFNDMTERIDFLIKANQKEMEEKNQQKINALVSQLSPHFIYNSLNTIKWMAVLNKQYNIQKVTESLISILRNAAQNDDGAYTLGDELSLIESYAVIEKARFMNFTLKIEVSPLARQCIIGKLMVQPLVENSIMHGFGRGKIHAGIIRVSGVIQDRVLSISVEDNGQGFDVDGWRANPTRQEGHTSIGLSHITEILQLKYGASSHLEIRSIPSKGTVVSFAIPALFLQKDGRYDSDYRC
jgi:sensor histidine kinase YesM